MNQPTKTTGEGMYALVRELYPICRSITGDGVRQTHEIIKRHIPIETHEIPSGTPVFDWTVPDEWNIIDAFILDPSGKKIVDFKQSNLHVVNYSLPIRAKKTLGDLAPHLHSLPEYPDVIPYITSYYQKNWGFCLTHNQYLSLREGTYDVVIDATLKKGFLTYSEYFLPGKKKEEILISCYTCHPSLCNDNLSGVALTTFLADCLSGMSLEYSYRFLFIPETIGALTWLCMNEENLHKIKYGLVVTCVGDRGRVTYQKTKDGDTELDQAVRHVLHHAGEGYALRDFLPFGSDERQFSSPGFNIQMASLMRTPYLKYPEYHTSADNLDVVSARSLQDSLDCYLAVIKIIENNHIYVSNNPKGEPFFSKYGLYRSLGTAASTHEALFGVMSFSDGTHCLLDIADRCQKPFQEVLSAALLLKKAGLIEVK